MTLYKLIKCAASTARYAAWAIAALIGTAVMGYIIGAIITIFGK